MKKYYILLLMLVGTCFLHAQVQQSTVVVKETEPLIVNGHVAFLGIPVRQSRAVLETKLREKGIIHKGKDTYGNDLGLQGIVYGVKSSVYIEGEYNQEPYADGISFRELKNYSKTQARNRVKAYQKAFLEATGGKVTENDMSYNSDEGGRVEIEAGKGYILIQYSNEDEVFFESPYYNVIVQFRDFSPATPTNTDGQASASTSPTKNITLTNNEEGKGKKSGKGVLEWSDGSRYEGDVKNGMRNGQGRYIFANGDVYSGGWKDDKMHGKGIYRSKNGDMYEGDYMNGERTGQGIFTYADTMKYVGQFKKGLKDGFGTLTWADGSLYEGYWVEDNAHGRGKLTLAIGYVYDGEWADGQMNGEGVILLSDGTKFKGHFKNGMKNGKGVEETADGTRFEGFFVNDQKEGPYVEKDRTGKVIRQGIYNSNNTDSNKEKQDDKNAGMRFSTCERQDDGQTSNGAYAALDVSLAVPKGEGGAQRNVARGIRAICDRSPVAEKLGKAPADATIEGVADYYASAFKKGLRTGKVNPMCTYSLRISEKFQNKTGVVFSVTTGVWGNGGPWEYDTFVSFSDGRVLDSGNLVKIPAAKLRALVKKYESEELSTTISVEEGDYQVMPAADGKANLHVSMGSHFFENVEVPVDEIASYLTVEGKAVFEVQAKNTSVAAPVPADAQNCRQERLIVMNGGTINSYNVVCGSFDNVDEANNLCKNLVAKKYSAQVVQNPDTGKYRVIAASFDNYASVVQARNKLRSTYPNAWLLYRIY